MSDIAAGFVHVAFDKVDEEIDSSLRRVREFFEVGYCALSEVSPDRETVQFVYAAVADGFSKMPAHGNIAVSCPWSFRKLIREGQPVKVLSLDDLPPEAWLDRQGWTERGVRAVLLVPVVIDGQVRYLVDIASDKSWRHCPEEYVPRLGLLGKIIANALVRKHNELAIHDSGGFSSKLLQDKIDRFRAVAFATTDIVYEQDIEEHRIRVYGNAEQFLGYPLQDLFRKFENMEGLLKQVHPEDRTRVREAIGHFAQTGEMYDVIARFLCRDGSYAYIHDRAVIVERKQGRPVRWIGAAKDITDRKEAENSLQKAYAEIQQLKDRLEAENMYLRKEMIQGRHFADIVGESDVMKYTLYRVKQVAATDTTVLILGETGTGKGLVAQAIHKSSDRKNKQFVNVNCATLPANLIESELFGNEKGAFTGAENRRIGRFELAHGGTIFLDEIGEMPLDLQAKLLRVIENGEFERLGSSRTVKVDVRIIAATNRDLEEEVGKGLFREDLFYRLNVFPITTPPLRKRKDDIPLLVGFFLKRYEKKLGKEIQSIPESTMKELQEYAWPGNIRELENVIERAVIVSHDDNLHLAEQLKASLPDHRQNPAPKGLKEIEREYIVNTLKDCDWKVEGADGAAAVLGLKPSTLRSRMKKMRIQRFEN